MSNQSVQNPVLKCGHEAMREDISKLNLEWDEHTRKTGRWEARNAAL